MACVFFSSSVRPSVRPSVRRRRRRRPYWGVFFYWLCYRAPKVVRGWKVESLDISRNVPVCVLFGDFVPDISQNVLQYPRYFTFCPAYFVYFCMIFKMSRLVVRQIQKCLGMVFLQITIGRTFQEMSDPLRLMKILSLDISGFVLQQA